MSTAAFSRNLEDWSFPASLFFYISRTEIGVMPLESNRQIALLHLGLLSLLFKVFVFNFVFIKRIDQEEFVS